MLSPRERVDQLQADVDQQAAELARLRKLVGVVMLTALCAAALALGYRQAVGA